MQRQTGYTVIEILVSLVIIGILAALGFVGFRDTVQNNRAVTMSNDFIASLAYARSEAIKRGATVTICAAANSNLLSCGTNNDWINGWIIFMDPNNTGSVPNSTSRLKVHDALDAGSQINTTITRITYNSAGYAIVGAGTFNLTATGCQGNNGRQLTITNYGRTDIVNTGC